MFPFLLSMAETSNTQNVEFWQDVNRKLDKKRLENSLALSLPKFMEAYGDSMSKKDREAFQTAVSDVLDSIHNGVVNERTINRELVFKDGKERGIENKRMKQAYGLAANFVNSVLDAMPEVVEQPTGVEQVIPEQQTERTETQTEKPVEKKVETTAPQNPIDVLQQKLNKKRELKLQKLANWDVESAPIVMQLPQTNYNEDSVLGMYKKMKLGTGYAHYFRSKVAPEFFANLNNILSPEKLGTKDLQITNTFGHSMSAKQHIVNTLDFFVKHPDLVPNNGEFNILQSGKVTIPGSFNEDSGTILLYDPRNRTVSRESITNEPELFNHYQQKLGLVQPQQQQKEDNLVPINKEGGVLKFEYGGTAIANYSGRDYMTDDQLNDYINSYQTFSDKMQQAKLEKAQDIKQQKLDAVSKAAKAKGRTVEQQQKMTQALGDKIQLSGTDIARLTSAVADLGAIGAAFAGPGSGGVGTLVSAGLGAGATLTNLGADLADGENVWSSLGNAGINLGLDTIGLIPGLGTSGKLGKVVKTLTKVAPWVIASMSMQNLGEEVKSFKKLLTDPTSVSADDLNNVASGLSIILGLKQGLKGRSIRKKALVSDKIGIRTESGKVAILDKSEVENLKGNKALQEKINKIKGFENEKVTGAFVPETKNWKNAWGKFEKKPESLNIYDFSKVNGYGNKYSDANVYEKLTYGAPYRSQTTINTTTVPQVTNSPLKSGMARYVEPSPAEIAQSKYAQTIRNQRLAQMRHTNVPGPYKPKPYQKGDYAKAYPESKYGFGFKDGGTLKMQQGGSFWYSPIHTFDPNNYKTTWGNTPYGLNNKNQYIEGFAYTNNGLGTNANRYKPDPRYSDFSQKGQNYVKSVEAQDNYLNFSTNLLNSYDKYLENPNDKNNLFYSWANTYDKSLPKGSLSSFFDENGQLRKSWTLKNKDVYGRTTKNTYTDPRVYLEHLRFDNIAAQGHNDFLQQGTRFFYKDNTGKEHWVSPEESKYYTVSKDPVRNSIEGNTKWSDYELTGPTNNSAQKDFMLGETKLPEKGKSTLEAINEYNNSPEGLRLKADLSEAARAYYLKMQNLKRLKMMNDFQPYHIEHPTFERQTTDMTNVLKAAYDNGNQAMAKQNIPRYADASLNEAMKRETASDVRNNIMQAENQNAKSINQQRDANDKIAMQNEQMRIDTANKNRQLDYAADEEKRLNRMKIHAANTDIDNAYWMKQNYDLAQKAQRQEDLQDWWKGQQIGTRGEEEQLLLSTDRTYNRNLQRLTELMNKGQDKNNPGFTRLVNENNAIVNRIRQQAYENIMNRTAQIYGLRRVAPMQRPVTYQPEIALNASGGSIKIVTKTKDNESAKLRARSKDNDRFMRAVSKTVDAFLAQDKQLGKSLLHKLTLKI